MQPGGAEATAPQTLYVVSLLAASAETTKCEQEKS